MGWTIGVLGFDSQWELGIFLFTTVSRMALGPTQPPIQWVPVAPSLGVKRPGHETDHSPPSSTRMRGAIPPLPQYVFMVWCLVKHRDNFTFLPLQYILFTVSTRIGFNHLKDESHNHRNLHCHYFCESQQIKEYFTQNFMYLYDLSSS
jgi:hypothetical protein